MPPRGEPERAFGRDVDGIGGELLNLRADRAPAGKREADFGI